MRTNTVLLLSALLQGVAGLKTSSFYNRKTSIQADEGKPVFYAVIMGNLAFRHQVSMWLGSLRQVGGWKGEAVIVTDHAKCLAKTLLEAKLLGPMLTSDENVDIFGPAEGYAGNVHLVKRPLAHSINKMKLEKARAWLNLKNAAIPHPVSSVIYTDEDVVIGKNIANFVGVIRELEKAKHTLALFRDTGSAAGELHTGVVAMFPGEATDKCLQAWGKKLTGVGIGSAQVQIGEAPADLNKMRKTKMVTRQKFPYPDFLINNATWGSAMFMEGPSETVEVYEDDGTDVVPKPDAKAEASLNVNEAEENLDIKEDTLLQEELVEMGPDQQALGRTQECKRQKGHDGVRILPKQFFWLPTAPGLRSGRQAEFVHFTNTGRWKLISHNTIKTYLTKIGVDPNIDPMGYVHDKECAVPEGGTIKDVKKGPTDYKR